MAVALSESVDSSPHGQYICFIGCKVITIFLFGLPHEAIDTVANCYLYSTNLRERERERDRERERTQKYDSLMPTVIKVCTTYDRCLSPCNAVGQGNSNFRNSHFLGVSLQQFACSWIKTSL